MASQQCRHRLHNPWEGEAGEALDKRVASALTAAEVTIELSKSLTDLRRAVGPIRQARQVDKNNSVIKRMLDLLRPIYRKTAANGHFGRDEPEFTWERIDKAETLRTAAGL